MKKKIEIEVEIPDCKDDCKSALLMGYLEKVDDFTYGHILGSIAGSLHSKGLITEEESFEFLNKFSRG